MPWKRLCTCAGVLCQTDEDELRRALVQVATMGFCVKIIIIESLLKLPRCADFLLSMLQYGRLCSDSHPINQVVCTGITFKLSDRNQKASRRPCSTPDKASQEHPSPQTAENKHNSARFSPCQSLEHLSLGIQTAQSRYYLYTLGPKVGVIYVLGSRGYSSRPYNDSSTTIHLQINPPYTNRQFWFLVAPGLTKPWRMMLSKAIRSLSPLLMCGRSGPLWTVRIYSGFFGPSWSRLHGGPRHAC